MLSSDYDKLMAVAMKKGVHRRAKTILAHLEWAKKEYPNQESDVLHGLEKRLKWSIRRLLFGVRPVPILQWNGKRTESISRHSQERLAPELTYIDLPKGDKGLWMMVTNARKAGYTFLGVKSGTSKTAVFVQTGLIQVALVKAFGVKIAMQIAKDDSMKALQNGIILLCRTGMGALNNQKIEWPTTVSDDIRPDGLIARLSRGSFQQIIDCWLLPADTRWVQVTILDRENGNATKGAIVMCEAGEEPVTYKASWKFGCTTGSLNSNCMLIGNADSLYTPKPRINLQTLVYNFTKEEANQIIDSFFLTELDKLKGFSHFSRARGIEKLMALGIGVNLPGPDGECRAYKFHKKLVEETALGAPIPGIRVKAVSDTNLQPYEIRVPLYSPWAIGDMVDVERDPSLPVGNSIQRYTVVGYCQGNLVYVNDQPWTTIQGGDFDGDDASVTSATVELLPGKVYNKTTMSEIECKKRPIKGVLSEKARVQQAQRVLSSNIGRWDLLARRAYDLGMLDKTAAFQISQLLQAEVMIMKHMIKPPEPIKIEGICAGTHPVDAVRCGEWDSPILVGSIYEPIAKKVREVLETWPPMRGIDQNMIKIPDAPAPVLARMEELARFFSATFRHMASKKGDEKVPQEDYDRLSLRIMLKRKQMERRNPAYKGVFNHVLAKNANGNLLCKVLTIQELAEVLQGSIVDL